MPRSAKIIFLFLAAFTVPMLLATYVSMVVFEAGCDPKFGCKLSFELASRFLTLPAAILTTISASIGVWRYRPDFDSVKIAAFVFGILSLPFLLLVTFTEALHVFAPTVLAACYYLAGPFILCRLHAHRQE